MLREPKAPLEGEESEGIEGEDSQDWVGIADEAYKSSTDYLDANYRKQWEKNVANFKSEHPAGSKYHTNAYRARSKLFRPKTRAAVRKAEASYAQAMFATTDVINLEPVDQSDKEEDIRTEIWQSALNWRLKNSIPWFLTAVGAFQESKVYGIVCSRQDWETEVIPGSTEKDPDTGETYEVEPEQVIKDQPRCELIEIENIRFDPASKWYDPVKTSPYFIELMPMFIGDVMAMMEVNDPKTGKPPWIKMDRGEILANGRKVEETGNTTAQAREGQDKSDPNDAEHKVKEFEIVWVHHNYVMKDGIDYEYYTLTTKKLLSEPVPVTSILGRPYRIGISSIEAHRCIPSGDVELNQHLQSEANDIVNQRLDNVKLALNKGHFVQRRANTDISTLKRSYPGRLVMTDDINAIKPDETRDVTGSSYQEQDRLNADIDDLLGGFSSGSVMTNRSMNETVGGMNRIAQSSNDITGYSIRVFVETWVEPVLSDLVKLIQEYESDENIMRFTKTAGIQEPIQRDQLLLNTNASVSVGFGELDPKARSQQVVQSLQVLANITPWAMSAADVKMIAKELFAPIGLRDGSKFFSQLPDGPPEQQPDPMVDLKRQELEMKSQVEMARLKNDFEINMMRLALQEKLTMEQVYAKLDLDMDKHNLEIMKEMGRREKTERDYTEMHLKSLLGEGI